MNCQILTLGVLFLKIFLIFAYVLYFKPSTYTCLAVATLFNCPQYQQEKVYILFWLFSQISILPQPRVSSERFPSLSHDVIDPFPPSSLSIFKFVAKTFIYHSPLDQSYPLNPGCVSFSVLLYIATIESLLLNI